jgi:hypothetical protein
MIIRKDQAAVDQGTEEWALKYGASESVHLSDEGGLTRFGANLQTLGRYGRLRTEGSSATG